MAEQRCEGAMEPCGGGVQRRRAGGVGAVRGRAERWLCNERAPGAERRAGRVCAQRCVRRGVRRAQGGVRTVVQMPMAVVPILMASMAYSTWKRRPSGEKVFTPRSYSLRVRNI